MKIEMSKFVFDNSHWFSFSVNFANKTSGIEGFSVGKMTHINIILQTT